MAKSEKHSLSSHKDKVGQEMHRWKHGPGLHSGRGKGGGAGKVIPANRPDWALAVALSVAGKKKGNDHAESLMAMGYSEESAKIVSNLLSN